MNISPVRIYINGNGSISFFGPNNTLITNLQNLNGAKQANGQIIFEGDDKTVSFYVYQLTSIESATFSLPYSVLDSRFFNPTVYSSKLNAVYQDVAEYVLVNKNGGASFVGGVVAVYPNYASFPATGQEAVIYIDEGTNQAYFWDGSAYQLLVSTGVEQYANFASFPVTGSANVIYIDMSVPEPYVWDGAAYQSLGGGAVTSVDTEGLISGGPITGSGTITTSMATNKLVGRYSASTGIMEEITIGSGLTLTGAGILNNTATPTPIGYYGAFQDSTRQTAAAINTPYAVRLNTTDLSNSITIVNNGSGDPTRITIANTGIYNIQFSLQLEKSGGSGNMTADIWLRKNGVDVPSTTGKVVLTGSASASPIIAAWNYVLDVVGGDYYELMWAVSNIHVEIFAEAATPPHPATPSAILTVTQQSGIMAGTGITAINSLTGAVQTLATGTTGTDFAISSTGTTHTFNLPTASAANRGALSSTDWSTFNGKENTANKQNSLAVDGTGVKFPTVDAVNNLSFIDKFKRGLQYFTDYDNTASSTPNFTQFSSGAGASVIRQVTNIPNATASQIGFAQFQTGTTATGYITQTNEGFIGAQFFFGGGTWVFETFVNVEILSDASNRFRFISGFGNAATNGSESNGTFFTYDEGATQNGTAASLNWQTQTCNASVRTLTTTSVAVTAGAWTKLRIEVNAAATSVAFYINGTLVATHTTNIPKWLAANNPRGFNVKQSIVKTIGTTTRSVFCDYFGYENYLTTPRT